MNTLLDNGTIALRALEPTDLDRLLAWENDTALWAVTDTIAPFSRHLIWQYLQDYDGDIYRMRQLRLVITRLADGAALGTVDLLNFDPLNNRAELGLFVARDARGAGVGGQAVDLVCDYVARHLGIRQLYVHIAADNAPCLELFRQKRFAEVGTLRQWVKRGTAYHDIVLMQRLFA